MTTSTAFLLPAPLASMLSQLPAYPGSVLLVGALNRLLLPHLPEDVRAHLRNKRLRIHVRDAGLTFDFTCLGARFSAIAAAPSSDLTITANAQDFLRLAQRQEDPDTLFFNRRLLMEGDTELGLVVKNALDAMEAPVFSLPSWLPRPLLDRLRR
jgi:predicted lipid carrier protein YhbT